jgi:hypothetical protein
MKAVLYRPEPAGASSGPIVLSITGQLGAIEANAAAKGLSFVQVPMGSPDDLDVTHHVVAGVVVERAPE